MKAQFEPAQKAELMNPLVLAYAGDAVYELFVRQYLISKLVSKPQQLHNLAVHYVSAKAQSQALRALLPVLSEEEREIVKKGRNAKSGKVPRSADVQEYRHSTAFECLIGYLFYRNRHDRLHDIMRTAICILERGSAEGGNLQRFPPHD